MSDEVIEVDEVLERVQDDKELLVELLDIFQEDYEAKRKAISEHVDNKNFEEIKNIAHSLKGASSNISAKRIFAVFSDLEDIAPDGNVEDINKLVSGLDREYEELKSSIEQLKIKFNQS